MTTAPFYKDALVLCGAGLFNEAGALMDAIYEVGINDDEERVLTGSL